MYTQKTEVVQHPCGPTGSQVQVAKGQQSRSSSFFPRPQPITGCPMPSGLLCREGRGPGIGALGQSYGAGAGEQSWGSGEQSGVPGRGKVDDYGWVHRLVIHSAHGRIHIGGGPVRHDTIPCKVSTHCQARTCSSEGILRVWSPRGTWLPWAEYVWGRLLQLSNPVPSSVK
jgi:hypothetical protein